MGTPSLSLSSFRNPLNIKNTFKTSATHFNKHLVCTTCSSLSLPSSMVKLSTFSHLVLNSANFRSSHFTKPIKCGFIDNHSSNFPFQPHVFSPLGLNSANFGRSHMIKPVKCAITGNPSSKFQFLSQVFDQVKEILSSLTAFGVCKWLVIAAIAVSLIKWSVNFVVNPFVWMYFSWTWMFWPWFVAIGLGVYGVYSFRKHLRGEASVVEQLAVVSSAFTWLTLVPPGFFNGFLEGWPFVFFLVYHYFFFFNVSIRKRLYGDYNARPHDPKWDVNVPSWYQVLFGVAVTVGHWLAAFEAPELQLIPGGWSNVGIWGLIMVTLFTQYNASLYLANYSENVVVPTAVVQFGPYRWVRHPIYASTMLLFLSYFVALRAPLSCLYIVAVCIMYYDQKAKVEEALMVDTFGEGYLEYASKVKYKFIPFIY